MHTYEDNYFESEELATLGADSVAYVRKMSGAEVHSAVGEELGLDNAETFWGLFAADGTPLMFSDHPEKVFNGAFYNDLQTIHLN